MRVAWSNSVIGRMKNFLKEYEGVLDKRRRELVWEIFEGVIRSRSLILAEVARNMRRPGADLQGKENRLSRQMKSHSWTHQALQEVLLRQSAAQAKDWTLIAVDLTDLAKPRARKMEALDHVRDGSRNEPVTGYWLFESYAVIRKGKLLPLLCFPYSLRSEENRSENWVIQQALTKLKEALGSKGIFVFDRGFDRFELLRLFEERNMRFILRLRGDRDVLSPHGENLGSAQEVAAGLPDAWWYRVRGVASGGQLAWKGIKLPGMQGTYNLVVSRWRGAGREPMLLLTNLKVDKGMLAEKVLRIYLMRWSAEDAARFLKQEVGLESFLVRNLRAITKLVTIAFMVMAFLALLAEIPEASLKKLMELGQSFRKRVDFLYYRIIWGFRALLLLLRDGPMSQTD